ncbi:Nck-associated protein 1, partial [Borealophlyctis nickersoniae]
MSLDMHKWSDHLLLLNTHSNTLLTSLHCAKQLLQDPNAASGSPTSNDILSKGGSPDVAFAYKGEAVSPMSPSRPALERLRVLAEAGETGIGEVFKRMIKKFPEVGDLAKLSGYQAFQSASDTILEDFRPFYDLLTACTEWAETAIAVLHQSMNFVALSRDTNPDLVTAFLDLLVNYVSVIYMVHGLGNERKIVASGYAKAWEVVNRNQEIQWARLSRFIANHEKPLAALQESLGPVAPRIFSFVLELKMDLTTRLGVTAEGYRKTGVLSLVPEMSGVKAPEADEKHLLGLTLQNRIFSTIIIGFLVCPQEIIKNPASLDVLKQALGYGYVVPLVRNETLNYTSEFDASIKSHSKLSKILKGVINDTLTLNQPLIHPFHAGRRDYLRHHLRQILSLVSSSTPLLCAKFAVVTAALGFAREEILWYFWHLDDAAGGGKKKKKAVEGRGWDTGVVELCWLVGEVGRRIMACVDAIRSTLATHMANVHAPTLITILESAFQSFPELANEATGMLLGAILDTLRVIPTDQVSELVSGGGFEGLRLNWLRYQVCAALPTTAANIQDSATLITLMNELYNKSKWLDTFDTQLTSLTSLRLLYYYQTPLQELLKECMDSSPEMMRCVGVLGTIAESFLGNVSPGWPAEAKQLQIHTPLFATEIYSILGQYAASVAHDVAVLNAQYALQAVPSEAVAFLPGVG